MSNNNNFATKVVVGGTGVITAGVMALGIAFVKPEEGRSLISYLDPVGVPTICDGITRYSNGEKVQLKQTRTDKECDELLAGELGKAIATVDKTILLPLSDYQRAGLGSFTYNVGVSAFKNSTAVKFINQGDFVNGCDQLRRWRMLKTPVGGYDDMLDKRRDGMKDCALKGLKKPCNGIVRRRERERAYCLKLDSEGDNVFLNP